MNKENKEKKENSDSLLPISAKDRIMGKGSYFMLFLGACVNLGIFSIGCAQLEIGLNMMQIFLAMFIGLTVLVVIMCLNDQFGYTTGAPYAIHLKGTYGTKGSIIPVIIRGIPGIVWFGFQSWLAASAINNISIIVANYSNVVLYFVLFQVLQVILTMKGFKGIKWVENVGGVVLTIALLYMLYVCVTKYGNVMHSLIDQKPVWGIPFIAAALAFFGNGSLMLVNLSDFSREFETGHSAFSRGCIYFLPEAPITMLLGLIGFMSFAATGVANPINAFSMMVDNKFLLVITLLFIIFAQITTNLVCNVIPAVYGLMDIFKMKYKPACIIIGIAGVCTCPWILTNDSSAAGLDTFIKIYASFCIPIISILIVDYFILHKKKYDQETLDELYNPNGVYEGINWAAIIATAVGAGIGLLNLNLNLITAAIPTGLVYYFCMKKMRACANFRKHTILDK